MKFKFIKYFQNFLCHHGLRRPYNDVCVPHNCILVNNVTVTQRLKFSLVISWWTLCFYAV